MEVVLAHHWPDIHCHDHRDDADRLVFRARCFFDDPDVGAVRDTLAISGVCGVLDPSAICWTAEPLVIAQSEDFWAVFLESNFVILIMLVLKHNIR